MQLRLLCGPLAVALALAGCSKLGGKSDTTKVSQTGGIATASADTTPKTPPPPIALPVTVEPARDGDLVLTIITSGQVRSENEAQLKSEVTATVQKVDIRPGQSVVRGQKLVEFDPRPFDLTMRQQQTAVDKATIDYRDLAMADSLAGRATTEAHRKTWMVASGLQSAQLNLEQATLDREKATIVAPFDGVIDRVDVTEGERVGGGSAIATIVDMKHLRIEAAVLEHDIPLIKEGGDATVSSSASPNQLAHGRIAAVLAIVDSNTHAGRAYVRLNGNGVLRPGMSVDVRLEANRLTNRRLVPKKAIIERDGRPLVFVVKDGRANWVYIQRGRDNGFDTEVLPDTITNEIPVKKGDLVITQGHLTLTHQALVRVVKKDDKP